MVGVARTWLRVLLFAVLIGLPGRDALPRADAAAAQALPDPAPFQVLASDLARVRIEIQAPPPLVEAASGTSADYDTVHVPGFGVDRQPGAPQLPVKGFMVGVPPGAEVELRILELSQTVLPGVHRVALAPTWQLPPTPPDLWETDILGSGVSLTQAGVEDTAIYQPDALYPAAPVQLTEIGYIRHQRVAHLAFYPVQTNPASGELVYNSRLVIELTFGYPAGAPDATRLTPHYEPDAFESLLRKSLVNYATARAWRDHAPAAHPHVLAQPAQAPHPGYRITVLDTGIYELGYDDLQAAGLPVNSLDPRTFQIFYHGQESAILVTGEEDGHFDPGDNILFFGQAIDGNYAKYARENVYWLTYGQSSGRRMSDQDGTPNGAPIPASFEETLHFEQDVNYWGLMPGEADDLARWYWAYSISPGWITQTVGLPGAVTGSATANLSFALHGYNDASAYIDHHVAISVNGNWVGEAQWEGISTYVGQFDFPQAYLQSGENLVHFESILDSGVTNSTNLLDWFEIRYLRGYQADQNQLAFGKDQTSPRELRVDNFASDALEVFNVTQPLSVSHVVNAVVQPSASGYLLRLGDSASSPTRYWALAPTQRLSPTSIQPDTPSQLSSPNNGADYLIITHHSFAADLLPLADYYAAIPGLRVKIVDVQDVYDEFSGGILYPGAIRAFLTYAFENWAEPPPTYVLLVGDGHYDFRFNHPLTNQAQYLPPYLARVDPWIGEAATDNRYVSLSGDDAWPDMIIGRFPVNSPAQAQAMVSKSLAYQQNPPPGDWNRKTLFVTDNPDAGGNFYIESDLIIDNYLPEPYTAERVYYGLSPYTVPADATAAIMAAISSGRLLVSYVGHAAIPWWAQERLFQTGNVGSLTNTTRWPVMLPMTCLEGQFSFFLSSFSSLSETMVRAAAKGAIASWAPTGYGLVSGHAYLEEGIFEALFLDGIRRLGDATLEGKRYLWENGGGYNRELIETYVLLGDPYLQVHTLKTELGIEKAIVPTTPLQPTDPLTYTLTIVNQGPAMAHHVVITDLLPSVIVDAQVVSSTLGLSQRPGAPFVWDVDDLTPGQSGTIVIRGAVDGWAGLGLFTNQAQIASAAWETGTLPNQDSVTALVVAGPPGLIQASASPLQIPVGGRVSSIEALVTDLWDNPVADGTLVSFSTNLGSVKPSTAATSDGLATTSLTSGPGAGIATVTAAAGAAQGAVAVAFLPGPPASVQLTANPIQIPVGGHTSTLTALARDQYGNPVADGTLVSFSTTKGSIAPTPVATVDGIAHSTLTSGTQAGVAVVAAQAGTASTSTNLVFAPGPPAAISLAATPPSIPVGGQAGLVASVADAFGNPVANGTPVTFSTSLGNVSPAVVPTSGGQVSSTLLAGTLVGQALVTAVAGGAAGQTVVPILPGPPALLGLVAIPAAIPVTGTSTLSATVADPYGNLVADGTWVNFRSTLGTMNPLAAPTWSGIATATLQAGGEPGWSTVTAWTGPASDSANVKIGPGVAVSLTLAATPDLIMADGAAEATITALVVDSFGEPITQVVPITFETTLGQVSPELEWVVNGTATTVLTGTQTGVAQVSAQAANTSNSVAVALVAGLPAQVGVTVTPAQVVIGGQAALQAQVADALGNPVADGTWVTFAASLGAAQPPTAVTLGGVAQSTFLAGTVAGTGAVTATTGAAVGTSAVTVLPGPVAAMTLASHPSVLEANGQDQAEIEAILVDSFGNPVIDGTEVTFGSTQGTVDPPTSYTLGGKATTTLTAGTVTGVAIVTAASGLASATVQTTLLPGPPAILGLMASPASLPADGQSQATLAVTVTDPFGNPVTNGTWVTFAASLGDVWPVTVTTQAGSAQSTLTSSVQAGLTLVTATAGTAWDHVWVTFRPGAAALISLSAAPPSLVADGFSTATVTALVVDAFGNKVKDGTQVAFATDMGKLSSRDSPTRDGIAQTTFHAGAHLGSATLAASAGVAWAQTQVPLVPGLPAYMALVTADVRLPVEGRFTTWVTATVRDAWSHPVADGTPVTFAAEIGSVEPSQAPTTNGIASTLYTGTRLGRWIEIQAAAGGGASDTVAVWLEPYDLWLPLVTRGASP